MNLFGRVKKNPLLSFGLELTTLKTTMGGAFPGIGTAGGLVSFCEWYSEDPFVYESLCNPVYCFHLPSVYKDKCCDFIYLMGSFLS